MAVCDSVLVPRVSLIKRHFMLRWRVCRAKLARNTFLSYEFSYEKCSEISPNFFSLYLVGPEKSSETHKISCKISLRKPKSHRRASAGAQGETCATHFPLSGTTLCSILAQNLSKLTCSCFSVSWKWTGLSAFFLFTRQRGQTLAYLSEKLEKAEGLDKVWGSVTHCRPKVRGRFAFPGARNPRSYSIRDYSRSFRGTLLSNSRKHPCHLRPVITKPVGRIFEISDSNPIRRKCGKCGRPLSPQKNIWV